MRRGSSPTGCALPSDLAGVRGDDPEADPHRRRLARSIGAEEAEDLACGDLEGQPVERRGRAESLRHVVDLQAHAAEDSPDPAIQGTAGWVPPGLGERTPAPFAADNGVGSSP